MKGDYWFGPDDVDRRVKYVRDFKPEFQENGEDVDRRIRALYATYCAETGRDAGAMKYSSGWRPRSVNDVTAGAGRGSNHLAANAGDVEDDAAGEFAWWCYRNTWALEQHGLWMEHPIATVTRAIEANKHPWAHLQRVPPGSGLRCYFPDKAAYETWSKLTKEAEHAAPSASDSSNS